MFDDLQYLFVSLPRVLTYFYDVQLLYPSHKFQTNWIFYREHTIQNIHIYHVDNMIKLMFLFYKSLLKFQYVWNFSKPPKQRVCACAVQSAPVTALEMRDSWSLYFQIPAHVSTHTSVLYCTLSNFKKWCTWF